jgi:cytochrome c-type biogenesis protein CcmH/NrfG
MVSMPSLKGARFGAFVLGLAVFAAVGYAQTGRIKGKVVDASNKPVEGATVVMESKEMNRKLTTKTDRRGEYSHFLAPGPYIVTVTKDNLTQTQETRVSIDEKELNFTLAPGGGGGGNVSEADRKKAEAERASITAAFSEGATLSNAGKFDEALARFNEVLTKVPKCVECYNNIGAIHMRKKDYPSAEAAYKKAIEVNPSSGESYLGLANVYNAQQKFPEAAAASEQAQKLLGGAAGAAGGGVNADAAYNQAVIGWNSLKGDAPPEAVRKVGETLEGAVKADPSHAEAHFLLAQLYVREGKFKEASGEFASYLKLSPNGPNAKAAQSTLEALKAYIKD